MPRRRLHRLGLPFRAVDDGTVGAVVILVEVPLVAASIMRAFFVFLVASVRRVRPLHVISGGGWSSSWSSSMFVVTCKLTWHIVWIIFPSPPWSWCVATTFPCPPPPFHHCHNTTKQEVTATRPPQLPPGTTSDQQWPETDADGGDANRYVFVFFEFLYRYFIIATSKKYTNAPQHACKRQQQQLQGPNDGLSVVWRLDVCFFFGFLICRLTY